MARSVQPAKQGSDWWKFLIASFVSLFFSSLFYQGTEISKNLYSIFIIGWLALLCVAVAEFLKYLKSIKTDKLNNVNQKSMPKKNKNLLILALIIIVAFFALASWLNKDSSVVAPKNGSGSSQSSPTSLSGNWVLYNATQDNFSVLIPNNPTQDTSYQDSPNGKIKVDSYKTADDTASVAYMVNVSEFPSSADLSDSNAILENTVNLSVKDGTLLTKNSTTSNGYPAISYLVEYNNPNSISRIRGLNILAGQRIYQLLTAYDKPEENKLEFEKFTNSFKVY